MANVLPTSHQVAIPSTTAHSPAAPVHPAVAPEPAGRHTAQHTRRSPAGRRIPRTVAFWLVAATIVTFLAASSAPSPLYPHYQAEFGFSALTLTAVFSVYVATLLLSLLSVGRLSDYVGRKPVLAAALLVEAVAMVVFLSADGVGWLYAARVIQGLATGAAVGVLGAYLLDLQPADGTRLGSLLNATAPTTGLGVGAIVTGALVQFAPAPTHLVFAILLALFLLLAATVPALPETVDRVPGALRSLRPRIAVPRAARRAFAGATPTIVSSWALGGLVLSVGGNVIVGIFHQTSIFTVGVLIGVFALAGAGSAAALSSINADRLATIGITTLTAGTALFVAALPTASLPLLVLALLLTGAGFGAGFLAALRSLTRLAQPHERAGLLSAIYVVSYLPFAVPAVVAGILIPHLGLRPTVLYYAALVAAIALARLLTTLRPTRTPATATD